MKTRTINSILFIIFAGFCAMNLPEVQETKLLEVDHALRSLYARRVLSGEYNKYVAQTQDSDGLEDYILAKVRKGFPKATKNEAIVIANTLISESNRFGFDPLFIMAIIQQESSFNPQARGGHGEIGLMQIRPTTARWVAKKFKLRFTEDEQLLDPVKSIEIGVRYLSWLHQKFDQPRESVSAYNMGARNVRRLLAKNTTPKIYFSKVNTRYKKFYLEIGRNVASQKDLIVAEAN